MRRLICSASTLQNSAAPWPARNENVNVSRKKHWGRANGRDKQTQSRCQKTVDHKSQNMGSEITYTRDPCYEFIGVYRAGVENIIQTCRPDSTGNWEVDTTGSNKLIVGYFVYNICAFIDCHACGSGATKTQSIMWAIYKLTQQNHFTHSTQIIFDLSQILAYCLTG